MAGSFAADISGFVRKTGMRTEQVCRAVKISLFNSVIMGTRVDTGRLRGNWQTTTGSPNMSTTDRLDPTGHSAIAEASANVKGFSVDYMTNNLPYAEVYEEKDGMVARNMARITRILEEANRG
jgi:hypothetical protein